MNTLLWNQWTALLYTTSTYRHLTVPNAATDTDDDRIFTVQCTAIASILPDTPHAGAQLLPQQPGGTRSNAAVGSTQQHCEDYL